MKRKRRWLAALFTCTVLAVTLIIASGISGCGGSGSGTTEPMVNVNTLDGQTNIAVNSSFMYAFSRASTASTITSSTYYILPTPIAEGSTSLSSNNKAALDETICDSANALNSTIGTVAFSMATLDPLNDLEDNANYTICVEGDSFMAQFSTGSSTSVTVTLSPADAATDVAVDAAVTAVFSDAITAPADWATAFTLKKDNAGDSLCTGVTYDSTTLTATCAHAALDRGSSYTTSVSGVTDSGGSAIDTATATFATVEAVVISSIKLVKLDSTEMETTDRPIPRSAKIKYTLATALTEESQRTAFETAVTVKDANDNEITGTYAWATDNLSTTFTPTRNLDFKTEYTITVDTGSLPIVNLSNAVDTETTFTTLSSRDINGDGYDDVIVGAAGYDPTHLGGSNGRAYLYHGSASGPSTTADTAITGAAVDKFLGTSVAMAGDVNADGYIDVIISAPNAAAGNNGEVYIFHGSATGIPNCDLSAGCTTMNATITGTAAADQLGDSVSFAGDVNGDGYDDVIVGASAAGVMPNHPGRAYVLHGSAIGVGNRDLSNLDNANTVLTGSADGALFGTSVSTAGDVDGDGYDDVIVGEEGTHKAYVFLGSDAGVGDCNLRDGPCTPNATIEGAFNPLLGNSVSTAGDVNGDGYDDVIIGGKNNGIAPVNKGCAWVFKGSATGIGDCNTIGACANLLSKIAGVGDDDHLGSSVYTAGDVNGDGTPDIIVGAVGASGEKGQAYVFFGSTLIADDDMTSAQADATFTGNTVPDPPWGSVLFGGVNGVSTVGDVNGDGYDDVIVGATAAPAPDSHDGQAYIFNGSATGPVTCDLSGACTADTTFEGGVSDMLGTVR